MTLNAVASWFQSKSLFHKGIAICGIIIIFVIFVDLILNRSLLTQYFYVLTYIAIASIASKATGNIIKNKFSRNRLYILLK